MTTWQSSGTFCSSVSQVSYSVAGLGRSTMKSLGPRKYAALLLSIVIILVLLESTRAMSADEKRKAKEQVVEMFYHAYNSYMEYAYPADELMPLSCKGRYRGSEPSRGDVDDSLGNFTLTLIDSLDTLAVFGDVEGFEEAVRNIARDARFDCDVIVSVFETNIRVLGGLLGGHVMATFFKRRKLGFDWYNNELLTQAKEVGDRLLPAFNTSTGIPYPRVNLKHGIVPQITSSHRDTCTACAGSMILEFAALSRLTGIAVYEEKARKAMDYLWQQRNRGSDLMGLIINVHSGDWIRRESGVGAGIDSYYEYVLKAYILLGDDDYLARFNKHYDAVMRYVSQGPLLMDVHMHKPTAVSRNFMDALLAFWPGLQVLKGDLVPAIETHEMLYQVMQRHNFIPEAFTTDFRVHWSHHPLRPEFIESTYFLYKATGDDYYLEAGKKVLDNLEEHARVACGYAAIKNVKTGTHEDQMDSYVLAEMFKYLYLLFAERSDLLFDIDDFIFTTEAHLLPLALSVGNITAAAASRLPKIRREVYNKFQVDIASPASDNYITTTTTTFTPGSHAKNDADETALEGEEEDEETDDQVCPNLHATHIDGRKYPHSVRSQIQNIVNRVSPQQKSHQPRLRASDFIAGNKEQLEMLHAMGIRIATMADGRIQLLHTASEALSPEDAENGMQFMQEMIELSKHQQTETQHDPMFVRISVPGLKPTRTVRAGPAQFGYDLKEGSPVSGMLAVARPFKVCKEVENAHELSGHIVILQRGDCMFVDKARHLQRIGARGGIVLDHTVGSSSETQPLFAMSGDGLNDVSIPLVFLYHKEGQELLQLLEDNSFVEVQLSAFPDNVEKVAGGGGEESGKGGAARPESLQARSGRTEEAKPLPVGLQEPAEPPTTTGSARREEGEEEELDSFEKNIGDKFYHHEAQLRDLYYLQVGSRYMHFNLEVRPSLTKPPPLSSRANAFSLDVLPSASKMVTVRLMYQSSGYEHQKPSLNQLYVDMVQLLQENSNFNDLPHDTDHLRALARFLQAGYFGMTSVDSDALVLMRLLARNLEQRHKFPEVPEPPDVDLISSGAGKEGEQSHLPEAPVDSERQERSYAEAEDFFEMPTQAEDSTDSRKQDVESAGDFVRVVPPDDGNVGYGARIDKDGVLNLVGEASQPPPRPRRTVSVRVSADGSKEEVTIKMTDNENTVSQSSFILQQDVRSDSSADTVTNTQQLPAESRNLPSVSEDSEPVRTTTEAGSVIRDHATATYHSEAQAAGDEQRSPHEGLRSRADSLPEGPLKDSSSSGGGHTTANIVPPPRGLSPARDDNTDTKPLGGGQDSHSVNREGAGSGSVHLDATQSSSGAHRTDSGRRTDHESAESTDRGRHHPADEL